MTKNKYFRYLGVNGYIETPIELPGVYNTSFYQITAEDGKILTDGQIFVNTVNVSEKDLGKWTEVDK